MAAPRLSVCMIVKNEAQSLSRALESVKSLASEINVVDTGSTDETIAIAQSFGARVFTFTWCDDFAAARNYAIAQATGNWILMLDGDEALSDELAKGLFRSLDDPTAGCYMTPMISISDGQQVDRAGVVRLFRNHPQYHFAGRIHEQLVTDDQGQGWVLKVLDLPIYHYGYTPSEDERKGRRERNRRMLLESLKEEPASPKYWFFLGKEEIAIREWGEAERCFRSAIQQDPTHLYSVMAGHVVANLMLARREVNDGWELAAKGSEWVNTRGESLALTGRIAIMEGDYLTAEALVHQLGSVQADGFSPSVSLPAMRHNLKAFAKWEQGDLDGALRAWEAGVKACPEDYSLADAWVRHRVLVHGLREGALAAIKKQQSPALMSVAIGTLLRAGELDLASHLAGRLGERRIFSPNTLYGLAHAGRWEQAAEAARLMGTEGWWRLATAAAWVNAEEPLAKALERITGTWQSVFQCVLQGHLVSDTHRWALATLLVEWADVGCIPLLLAGTQSFSGDVAHREAHLAWLLYQAGLVQPAVELAMQQANQPEALEVLGMVAFDAGDWEAASRYLTQRATGGPAAVRVYDRAIRALKRVGKRTQARELLVVGRRERPLSRLLAH